MSENNGLISGNTGENQQRLADKLYKLLEWQVKKYNGIDSTSISVSMAQELLDSLVYTLHIAADNQAVSDEELINSDLREFVCNGQIILENEFDTARQIHNRICLTAPDIKNIYFIETIKNIGVFFKKYDIHFFAHQIPCSIDYPLLTPISEDINGLSYIQEYLKRLDTENYFINQFDKASVHCLLKKSTPDFSDTFINMCGVVLTNAVGRQLINKDILQLNISAHERQELSLMLKYKTKDDCRKAMIDAIKNICGKLNIDNADSIEYFTTAVGELSARVDSALRYSGLENIFLTVT